MGLVNFFKTDENIQKEAAFFKQKKALWYYHIYYYVYFIKELFVVKRFWNYPKQLNYIFWCSDETQWKNQLPVIKKLINNHYSVAVYSNKSRIYNLSRNYNIESVLLPTSHLLRGNTFILESLEKKIKKVVKNNEQLKWVVIGNDLRWDDRIICKAFQNFGLKTAVINHGLNLISDKLKNMICDLHFAWSEAEKIRIIHSGQICTDIIVSGSPALDEVIFERQFKEQDKVDSFIEKNVQKGKNIILITFSGPGGMISVENHKACIKTIVDEYDLLLKNGFVPVVKLHPKDSIDYYNSFIELKGGIVIPKELNELNRNIYAWIKRSFALVSGPSTSIVDCILMHKPAIYCDIYKEGFEIGFVKENTIPVISYEFSLTSILKKLKENNSEYALQIKKQDTFLETIYQKPDGRSAERIVEHLI